jgi:hypothetical protein
VAVTAQGMDQRVQCDDSALEALHVDLPEGSEIVRQRLCWHGSALFQELDERLTVFVE